MGQSFSIEKCGLYGSDMARPRSQESERDRIAKTFDQRIQCFQTANLRVYRSMHSLEKLSRRLRQLSSVYFSEKKEGEGRNVWMIFRLFPSVILRFHLE